MLEQTSERYSDWSARGFELIDARLHGSFPGTYITVRLRIPDQEDVLEESWRLWTDEGGLTHDSLGLAYRLSPDFLIDQYLHSLVHP